MVVKRLNRHGIFAEGRVRSARCGARGPVPTVRFSSENAEFAKKPPEGYKKSSGYGQFQKSRGTSSRAHVYRRRQRWRPKTIIINLSKYGSGSLAKQIRRGHHSRLIATSVLVAVFRGPRRRVGRSTPRCSSCRQNINGFVARRNSTARWIAFTGRKWPRLGGKWLSGMLNRPRLCRRWRCGR